MSFDLSHPTDTARIWRRRLARLRASHRRSHPDEDDTRKHAYEGRDCVAQGNARPVIFVSNRLPITNAFTGAQQAVPRQARAAPQGRQTRNQMASSRG